VTTGTRNAAPATTGTALQDTTRANEKTQGHLSISGTIAGGVVNWTETAATPAPVTEKKLTKREREREAYLATARVKRIGPGHYEAESGSEPDTWHTCRLVRGHLSCSCRATGPCKHIIRCTPLLLADARLTEMENREADAPTLLSAERLAAARLAAQYSEDEPLWGRWS
jgi:hypothetical protein